jgi:ubiquinone/menaquinone biosynthesis C-methylase UbiE
MTYVSSGSESIPFDDNYFDVVCSFNSLDHVDNLKKSISEIKRVLKVGGLFLLLTDVNHEPTECEPIYFSFDITGQFKPFKVLDERHYEKSENGLYQSIHANVPYDHDNTEKRYGILAAKFKKM